MTRPTDRPGTPVPVDEQSIDEALSALDFVTPESATPAAETTPPVEPVFEADEQFARPPETAAPEPPFDDDEAPAIVRDAFGNRQRVRSEETEDPLSNLRLIVEMHGLPKNLARKVMAGELSVKTALRVHRRAKRGVTQQRTMSQGNKVAVVVGSLTALIIVSLYLLSLFTR